jgi:hypothetical protein
MTSESRPEDRRTADGIPPEAPAAAPEATPQRAPRRRRDLDWDRQPAAGVDPEDSLRGGGDDLDRLLADIPPHHVDRDAPH